MLLFPSRHRNALEHSPLRETREIAFSRAPTPPPTGTPVTPRSPDADPDDADDADGAPAAPAGAPGVPQNVGATRTAVAGALTGGGASEQREEEEKQVSITGLASKLRVMDKLISDIYDMLKLPEVKEAVAALGAEDRALWEEQVMIIDGERDKISYWKAISDELSDWDQMRRSPEEFARTVQRFQDGRPGEASVMASLRQQMDHTEDVRNWDLIGHASRIHAQDQLNTAAGMGAMLREMDAYKDVWADKLQNFKKALDQETDVRRKLRNEQASLLEGRSTGVLKKFGVTFHTPLEIWEGLKMVKEAFQSAVKDRLQRRAAEFALGVGRAAAGLKLPYGSDVESNVQKQVDSNENKAKNEYKDSLETLDPGFSKLLGEGGILDGSIRKPGQAGDTNMARAALEYAAGRGWLFGLADQQAKPIMVLKRYNLADMVPDHWDEGRVRGYLTTLIGQNLSGGEDQAKKVQDRVGKFDTLPPYIDALNEEFLKTNIWGAIGVCRAAVARAKSGEISARMAVLVVRDLRERENVRKYISGTELENFGFDTFHRAPFTLSQFAMNKDDLVRWLNAGGQEGELDGAGDLAKTIQKIERKILSHVYNADPAKGARLQNNKAELDEMVGNVLATKLVDAGDTKVSIFESDFDDYRLGSLLFNYMTKPEKMRDDDDYFGSQSEITYLPQQYITSLLSVTSTGTFGDAPKALLFLGQVYSRLKELAASNIPNITEKYRTEMRRKISEGMRETVLASKSLELLIGNKIRLNNKDDPMENKPAIALLLANGLIDPGIFPENPNPEKNVRGKIQEQIQALGIEQVEDQNRVTSTVPRTGARGRGNPGVAPVGLAA